MTDDAKCSALLAELDSIANSAMTGEQRETRAAPALNLSGISISDLKDCLEAESLAWNASKAKTFGVSPATWQRALYLAGVSAVQSLGDLLAALHRADAAAAMLRAGYKGERDAGGNVSWRS
jgi:hypothetical protein